MRILEHREKPFPEDLERRSSAILNVVNTEFKSLTLLHLDGVPTEEGEIRRRVRETVGRGTYLPLGGAFGAYCHHTLFPIGAVAEETVCHETLEGSVVGYTLTDAGRKYGQPIAAFSLDWAIDHNRSLFEVLGVTASSGNSRSPLNRIKILKRLKKGPARVSELSRLLYGSAKETPKKTPNRFRKNKIGSPQRHLEELERIGFIETTHCGEVVGPMVVYSWIDGGKPEETKPVKTYARLPKRIAEELRRLGTTNLEELEATLRIRRSLISMILSNLERRGLVEKEGGTSTAHLLGPGREFLDLYLTRVEKALSDGICLRTMTKRLEGDFKRENIQKAIELYKKVSPQINRRPSEKTQEEIIDLLRGNPGLRPSEIRSQMGLEGAGIYLSRLVKLGKLRKERHCKAVRYYINK